VLAEQFKHVVDDLVLSFGEKTRLRKGGLRNIDTGIRAAKLGDDLVEILFRAEALRSNTSTIAAISHMFETVASSRDMVSRLGRSLLKESSPRVSAPTPAHTAEGAPGCMAQP
jgi:hypothetical protein